MSQPIFRYIVVLLAVIVIVRILLSLSASVKKENDDQASLLSLEVKDQAGETDPLEIEQSEENTDQLSDPPNQSIDHE
ncbi:MAG: hypothetical protein PHW11_06950 [Anaerolineaceae bacterium]|jgi:hypothetical protein|nr:hypothetical protein [Anaerolineaceae bacterium]MDD4043335.1 hypothetical protein [Anaerolineaceae bacterium]MDD4578177.1 hypothetical protein [Anaerolineaceae bacterium]